MPPDSSILFIDLDKKNSAASSAEPFVQPVEQKTLVIA